ncbi:formate hydrogenlyase subunit 3/multisubunit Na+/H+ antiporter, MnhD subunit [Rubidibacter lacunae KORDI 51-2]|uniref:Formate hydrogenlyase subunit 3/multisubunit Na+/H+ antiporter, MnhD subunit n=1 Tax=Rubidibacter lacunae KORDI 51-2 TaxID=582515 RepID=U5DQE0_9CHRO|nr:cation:proton antiporter [Rubidibacter lacunae]ERN42834.1 formate hydrogenlyase subunit 3/multisubunit Na+/H+ antiporter, MnhD subunit [Rubidibacter lacunae KORDI 51-2]
MNETALLNTTTSVILWIAFPFIAGFGSFLLPKSDRLLAFGVCSTSLVYSFLQIFRPTSLTLKLMDSFGVTLILDSQSGFLVLTNAIVTAAVILYCQDRGKDAFFYASIIFLHGSINAVLISADFISSYVALEAVSIAAFLLIAHSRAKRAIWIGLRYLFVSNTAMLVYLLGAVLVYQTHHSFAYEGLKGAPQAATVCIILGLLTKGGVFVSGLWLPLTHSESETPVSALLSGIVVKTGVFPLVRCSLLVDDIQLILGVFSIATALLGVYYAILEQDSKRLLASSTISQMGFVLAAPSAAGYYALTHGLAKSSLFLTAGNLPSRNFKELRQTPIHVSFWVVLVIASLSISGFPLLAGFASKTQSLSLLYPWQKIAMNVAAVGTAIAFSKLIFLPVTVDPSASKEPITKPSFWASIGLLLASLLMANLFYLGAYTPSNVLKSLAIVAIGWLAHWVYFRKLVFCMFGPFERLDHLIGIVSVMMLLLFGMVTV